MRCLSCDVVLTDFEATRKSAETDEFLDLCNHCYSFIKSDVKAVERQDLMCVYDMIDTDDEMW